MSDKENHQPVFPLGQIFVTQNAMEALDKNGRNGSRLFLRHSQCDWGDVSDEVAKCNDNALNTGGKLESAYLLEDGTEIRITTEADRSISCCCLPSEC